MAIDILDTWKTEWANLPKVNDDSWKSNLADYLEARTLDLKIQSYTPDSNISFIFNKSVFLSNLTGIDSGIGNGAIVIGTAFKSAIDVSTIAVTAPISIGPASPTTTFSVVTASTFDPAASALASLKIAELANAEPVEDAIDSDYPVKIRDAVLLLTVSVGGLNSVSPTPGPLVDLGRSVI